MILLRFISWHLKEIWERSSKKKIQQVERLESATLHCSIASSFNTAIEVAPHNFAHCATSQSCWDWKGAQSESERAAQCMSYIEDP